MNRNHWIGKLFFYHLPYSFSGLLTLTIFYICSFINPHIINGSNFATHNKDTSIIICNNFLEINDLGIIPLYNDGKWNAVSGIVNILNSTTFNTTFEDINSGNSTLVWTSTNALEVLTIRISNRKPTAVILQTLDNEVLGGITCLKRLTLMTANPQKSIPTARGFWVTMQQPSENLGSLAYLNHVISKTGDSISTLAYNLTATGTYHFSWVVNEPTCGTDTAKLKIISRRNIATITTTDAENKPTCGLPVTVATAKTALSSAGNWKVGKVPTGAQTPVLSFESSTSTITRTKVLNFSRPGNYALWWVVSSITTNECPSDSQLINIVNMKPLAETEYASQFIDVCGSTILKAKNPALAGVGLTGHWILDKKPVNSPVINTSTLNFNSTVNFSKTGSYYFKWVVKKDLPSCVSDTIELVFNNIKPSSVSAGIDTTICSTFYELSAEQNLEGLPIASKGIWSVYYQPAQKDTVILDNNLNTKTIVRNLNTIGHYQFIWAVTTSSSTLPSCTNSDTVFIFNYLHPKFVVSSMPTSFCDTLKLMPPTREYPKNMIIPVESWKIVDNNSFTKDVLILNELNKGSRAVGFSKPGIYNFEYSFSFEGCIQKTTISALNLKASPIDIRNSGKEFCKDTIQLSAPLIESGFKGRWESVSYPPFSMPAITDSSRGNTTVKEFAKPGLYKFRWVLFPSRGTIQCLRYSDTIIYTNKKASKLPDYYKKDTNFCGSLLKLTSPVLDASFLTANSGWNILDAPDLLSQTIKGDTTIFENWGKVKKIKVIWFVANTQDLSCQRIDTIIRINQQPMLINAAGDDVEVCGKNSVATMSGKVNVDMANNKGTWRLMSKPLGALNPIFIGDSTSTNLKISGFSKAGIYKFNWTLRNLNCIEKDEMLVTNSAPDTIEATAFNTTTCKNFDSLRGTNLQGLEPFKNAKYSWRIINQPIKTGITEKAVLTDSLLPTCYISGMFLSGVYNIEYNITNGKCETKDTAVINRSQRFNAIVQQREYSTCEDSIIIKAIPEESIQGRWELVSGATKNPKPISADGATVCVNGLTYAEDNLFDWVVSPPGCQESRATVVVKKYKKPPNIKFSFKTIRVCEQDSIRLNAVSHTPSEGISDWYFNDKFLSADDSHVVSNLKYGRSSFRFRLVQPNQACASNWDSISVWRDRTFQEPIKLEYSNNLCVDSVQLSATEQQFATYKWTPFSTNPDIISQLPFSSSVNAKNLKKAGVYKIALQISRESCIFLDTAVISRGSSPSPAVITNKDFRNGETICESNITKTYTYTALPVIKGKGIWTFNQITLPEDTTTTKVVKFEIGPNKIIWTTKTDEVCKLSAEHIVILRAKPPEAMAGKDKIVYASNGNLDATYNSKSIENTAKWLFSSTNPTLVSDLSNPTSAYFNLPIGKSAFYWQIDNGSCPVEVDTVWITRLESKIPKGFSPNGDFVNNEFVIVGIEDYEASELTVFNRWGDLVYENKKYSNEWKGESEDGKSLPDGTYYYILKLGKDHEIKNYVVIKR